MKNIAYLALCSILLFACKKEEIEVPPYSNLADPITVTEEGSNDETARNEYDQSIENAFKALETTGFGSRGADSGVILPCGVLKVDTTGGKHRIVYGANCGRKVLSGEIVATLLSPAKKWREKGAVIKLEYKDYKVLFEVNNQTLVFNGTITITNVNGGLVYESILLRSTIEHKIRGNLNITFNNGKTRTWQVFKRRIYSAANGKIENLEAKLSADSTGNIAEVGIAKNGESFTTTVPTTLRYVNCGTGNQVGPFVLIEGKIKIEVGNNSLTAEAGQILDNGDIIAVNTCSATGYKLTWDVGGVSKVEFQYY